MGRFVVFNILIVIYWVSDLIIYIYELLVYILFFFWTVGKYRGYWVDGEEVGYV